MFKKHWPSICFIVFTVIVGPLLVYYFQNKMDDYERAKKIEHVQEFVAGKKAEAAASIAKKKEAVAASIDEKKAAAAAKLNGAKDKVGSAISGIFHRDEEQ